MKDGGFFFTIPYEIVHSEGKQRSLLQKTFGRSTEQKLRTSITTLCKIMHQIISV